MPSRESVGRTLANPAVAAVLAALSPVWLLALFEFPAGSDVATALRLLSVPGYLVLLAVDRVVAVGLGLGNENPLFWAIAALTFYAVAVLVAAGLRWARRALADRRA